MQARYTGLIKIRDRHEKHCLNFRRIPLHRLMVLKPDDDRGDSKAGTGRKIIQLTDHAGLRCVQAEFFFQFPKRCAVGIFPIVQAPSGQRILASVPGQPAGPSGQQKTSSTGGRVPHEHNGHSGWA